MSKEKTVLIFGAGATAALGMPLTEKQNDFFRTFFFSDVTDLKNYGLIDQDMKQFAALKKLKAEDEFNIEDLINFVKYFFIEDVHGRCLTPIYQHSNLSRLYRLITIILMEDKMGRKPSVEFKGADYHVIKRGNNRDYIFRTVRTKKTS